MTSLLVLITINYFDAFLFKPLSIPSGIIGTALAFLIGFRINTAYDRWWQSLGGYASL
ncbi:MAG: bestrophin family ion channel [Saprospiraceae bacterium]